MLIFQLFDRVRKERPSSFEKVIPVNGDISAEGLGLSPDDRQMLIERVSIVIHGAAIVKFNSTLKSVILSNIRATRDICILAEEMKNLIVSVKRMELLFLQNLLEIISRLQILYFICDYIHI